MDDRLVERLRAAGIVPDQVSDPHEVWLRLHEHFGLRATADAIGADLEILEGVGHQPMWEGGGGPLIEVLADFLDRLPAAR